MNDMTFQQFTGAPPARTFLDGSEYWVLELPSVRLGLGHFRPGWTWSKHAGKQTGQPSAAHIGYIQSGRMAVRSAQDQVAELGPGDAFEVGPGHDAWVVGDELCVALDMALKPRSSSAHG
jgi:hypothetical protein